MGAVSRYVNNKCMHIYWLTVVQQPQRLRQTTLKTSSGKTALDLELEILGDKDVERIAAHQSSTS